ncbi:2-polyprenyl-6-methoxyphenol hydroxylase-like FAD-dependent oxidoreductase [Chryseobacterium sp. H1D6B]|uniref:FAD-dependent monooxygenase n=1 Tax=Chryseobacterium sp. H1D6B TaxID=2940588 RepID=UPI0015C9A323|nr:FAD-dependent monooxygenase [Chryseobacterium sp. H1D6B]MDH6254159.1 2-polyprenyl-6-methoxyphenol hydroxylase-like FAD-dependent oxidoreductase [Chryseobacterium sp. H1D6B]
MNSKKKVLISGASIAGPTLGFWLAKYGFQVTIVERSKSLRLGGQNLDVRGAGRAVVRMMGVEKEILAANTGEIGLQFVNRNNKVEAEFPAEGGDSFTSEAEILRGDLVNILYKCTKNDVEYVFGKYITGIKQGSDKVEVTFSDNESESFDLLIAADGVRSTTRKLIFGDEPELKFLGLYNAWYTIPRIERDTQWARWYTAPGSRVMVLRPDNHGTIRASFSFLSDDKKYLSQSDNEQKKVLKEKLSGAGWEEERLMKEIDNNNEVYFDGISQVKAPRWFDGRAGMIGDAAYCPTPLTGMGTTLAMVGAYLLAGELSRHDKHEDAFAAYEKRMRPFVEKVQKLPPGVPWLAHPKSKLGVTVVNTAAGLLASRPIKMVSRLFSSKEKDVTKDEVELPIFE